MMSGSMMMIGSFSDPACMSGDGVAFVKRYQVRVCIGYLDGGGKGSGFTVGVKLAHQKTHGMEHRRRQFAGSGLYLFERPVYVVLHRILGHVYEVGDITVVVGKCRVYVEMPFGVLYCEIHDTAVLKSPRPECGRGPAERKEVGIRLLKDFFLEGCGPAHLGVEICVDHDAHHAFGGLGECVDGEIDAAPLADNELTEIAQEHTL